MPAARNLAASCIPAACLAHRLHAHRGWPCRLASAAAAAAAGSHVTAWHGSVSTRRSRVMMGCEAGWDACSERLGPRAPSGTCSARNSRLHMPACHNPDMFAHFAETINNPRKGTEATHCGPPCWGTRDPPRNPGRKGWRPSLRETSFLLVAAPARPKAFRPKLFMSSHDRSVSPDGAPLAACLAGRWELRACVAAARGLLPRLFAPRVAGAAPRHAEQPACCCEMGLDSSHAAGRELARLQLPPPPTSGRRVRRASWSSRLSIQPRPPAPPHMQRTTASGG